MDLNAPVSFVAKATMTTYLEYKGNVTLQELIEGGYLESSTASDDKAVQEAINQYSQNLDGGEFVKSPKHDGDWSLDSVQVLEK
ncbi:hypothetical protein QTV43_000063 [Vibrio vulnificus]|nr:hypothetical protein [Vibrio vulnificus]